MQDFTVAAVATKSEIGAAAKNLENIRVWALRAREGGAEFVLFPELSVCGFLLERNAWTLGEPVPGPSTDALVRIAAEADAIVAAGVVEESAGRYYNTHVIANSGGIVGTYRKTHINPFESPFYAEGNRHPVFDVGFARLGVSTCNDNLYPENIAALALAGAEVILMPFAYGGADHDAWQASPECAAYRTRGYDTGCFVVAVNNAGPVDVPNGGRYDYPGGAFVSDPHGRLVAETKGKDCGEKMLVARLSAEALHDRRSGKAFPMRLRRPEIYGSLSALT